MCLPLSSIIQQTTQRVRIPQERIAPANPSDTEPEEARALKKTLPGEADLENTTRPATITSSQETTEPQAMPRVQLGIAGSGNYRPTPLVEDNGLEPMTFWLPAKTIDVSPYFTSIFLMKSGV